MRKCSFAFLLLCACAWTQGLPVDTPEPVVAVVNGRKITKSEYRKILEAQDGNMRALAEKDPKQFLEQYALYEGVLAAAEKAGLDKQSPFKEKIAMMRRQILVSGLIDERHRSFVVPQEDVQAHYDKNKDLYRQVMVRVIFVSGMLETRNLGNDQVTNARSPEEALKRADAAAKLAREGTDFAQVAKEYSDDQESAAKGGAFPHPIRPNSNNVPQNIRTALFEAKAGDIVGPITHNTGFYVFKVESIGQAPLDQVKEDIVKEIKDSSLKQWLDEFKKNANISVPDETLLTEAAKGK